MGYILGEPTVQQYFDANGDPLSLGTIEFYLSGTSTPTPIYSDASGTSAGTSVSLNSIGAPQDSGGTAIALFFDDSIQYKIVRKDASGTVIPPTIDPYTPVPSIQYQKKIDSVAALYGGDFSSFDTIETRGFHGGWPETVAGPKGGAKWHKAGDGGTQTTALTLFDHLALGYVVDAGGNYWYMSSDQTFTPYQFGYNDDASDMTTPTIVDANWDAMKAYLTYVSSGEKLTLKFETKWTPEAIFAEWLAGRSAPIGVYSDSTSDGYGTTGHTASTGSDSPFKVTVTESPEAWTKRFQAIMQTSVFDSSIPARCYNGGFDSQSFLNGFGLKHWYNTWFRGLSGSNIDFSDVKMILLGFGTSDSVNADDPGSVIDAYQVDLECVIVDCFLRGVQPALMTPVLTTQNTGSTSGRKGWQSVSVIGAIQRKLADKYGLQVFSYGEAWRNVISHYDGYEYRDFMQSDMVHPTEKGHNLYASYLATKFNKNIETLKPGEVVNSLFAGHTCYNTDPDDNISGSILKYVPNLLGISDESYIYSWLSSDGNGKSADDWLVSATVYIDKPTALLMKDVDSNRTNKGITVQSYVAGANSTPSPLWQRSDQPDNTFYSHKSFLTLLPPGANTIYVTASDDGADQSFGGLYLVDIDAMNFNYDRGTNLAKAIRFPDVLNAYTPQARPSRNIGAYYNCADQSYMSLSFDIATDLDSGTAYFVRTHYNDVDANKDSYNIFEFDNDDFNIKVVNAGSPSTLFNTTISGLNALLASGAQVEIKMRSRFSSPLGFNVQLFVDGVAMDSKTANIGDMWSDGYGFDTDIFCRNIQIVSSVEQTGFGDVNNTI